VIFLNKVIPKDIVSVFNKFLYREIELSEFENWIYENDTLESLFGYDKYIDIISFNYKDPNTFYILEKIILDLFKEVGEGKVRSAADTIDERLSGKHIRNLSSRAKEMLSKGTRKRVPREYNMIIDILEKHKHPAIDNIVKFQQEYGGISYKLNKYDYGHELGILTYDSHYCVHRCCCRKYEDKYYFDFIESSEFSCIPGIIDEERRVFISYGSEAYLKADSIESLIEKHAVKYYFTNKNHMWLNRGVKIDALSKWLDSNKNEFVKIKEASDSNTIWWKSKDETVFLQFDGLNFPYPHGDIYCTNKEILYDLFKEKNIGVIKYPSRTLITLE
jgi:hypothetical protein